MCLVAGAAAKRRFTIIKHKLLRYFTGIAETIFGTRASLHRGEFSMSGSAAKQLSQPIAAPARIKRRFVRYNVSCEAVVAFPHQHAHARIKAHLFQIGAGGCALSTKDRPFIGEKCIVWAIGAGQRYLGIRGQIVWVKPVYEQNGAENGIHIGVEFEKPIDLTPTLLGHLQR